MSLYNMLFSENKDATVLLGMLSLTREIVPRYRDIFLTPEGDKIVILTRVGGLNRKGDYKDDIAALQKHEYYIKDYDDNYDNTYAYYEFNIPEKYKSTAKKMAPKEKELSIKEKFDKEISEMFIEGSPASKRADQIGESLIKVIESEIDDTTSKKNIKIIGI